LLVAILQSTLAPYLLIWGVKPDLMLLLVVSWNLLRGAGGGVLWSALGGLALDLFSSAPFGTSTVALFCVGSLTRLAAMNVFRLGLAMPLAAAALATLGYDLILLFSLHLFGRAVVWEDALLRIIIPSVFVNTLLMPVVFGGVRWIRKHTGPEQIGW
jgi:rod shape-determining protein MreD